MYFDETFASTSKPSVDIHYKRTSPTPAWSTFRPVSASREFFSATAQRNEKTSIRAKVFPETGLGNHHSKMQIQILVSRFIKVVIVFAVNGMDLMRALLFERELLICSPTLTSLLCHFSICQVLGVRENLERECRTHHAANRSQQSCTQSKHKLLKHRGVREEFHGVRVSQR